MQSTPPSTQGHPHSLLTLPPVDRYQSPVFRSGKNQIKLRGTPKTVVVEVNGTTIVNWAGDPTTLSIEYYRQAGEGKAFLGTWNAEYIVSRIDVRSL